ncbi:MAG: membrane protein insertase YidC [Candidatus Omnitrophota bacterium]
MEKRTILAIALSLLILITWSMFTSPPHLVENKAVTEKTAPLLGIPEARVPPQDQEVTEEIPPSSLIKLEREKLEITFVEPKAAIQEVVFKAHQNYTLPLKYGFLIEDKSLSFKKQSSSSKEVVFVHSNHAQKITKKFIFSNSAYDMWLEINVQNVSSAPLTFSPQVILGELDFSAGNKQAQFQDVVIATKDKTGHYNGRKSLDLPDIKFLSLREKYFCAIVEPENERSLGFVRKKSGQESEVGLKIPEIIIAPGQSAIEKFHIYLGPQDLHIINKIQPSWSGIIYYGTFDIISQVLLQLLEFFHSMVHSWGWAIVILSLLVYFVLYPLSIKQMRSMKEMQALQPKIEELRKTYKDNPQRLNKEIMALYKEHKVNPFGGCLPLLLQMPIFFALYQALMRSVALKGAAFLWIKDLSEPDRLFLLPNSLPILGNEVNILPIVMAIGMFVQQKLSSASASGAAADQQKMMLFIMPIMFGVIFYHMPSGLVLYWFINSALMLIFQVRLSRVK